MANATKDRNTVKKAPTVNGFQYVANALAARFYPFGVMIAVDANNRAINPGEVAAKPVMGVTKQSVDNTLGANDAKAVELEGGEFEFAKHATNPPTAADIGLTVYASDNQTISRLSTDGVPAGKLAGVNASSVDVGVGPTYL